jgi:DNA invertase Pin-like site-specific DNA recombinase
MSRDKQEDSPERQRGQIEAHAQKCGYAIGKYYCDLGIAGDDSTRPEFVRLLLDATQGMFDLLLIDEPSRLSRHKPSQFIAEVVYPLEKAKVSVESVSAGLLRLDDIGSLIMTAVLADRSSSEVKNLSRRVLDGMARSTRAASWNSVPPFGYLLRVKRDRVNTNKVISRRLVPGKAKHVAAVQWMFREYAKGRTGLPRIVKRFASWNIFSKKQHSDGVARPMTPQAIWAMLRNSAYVGDTVWNKHSKGKYSKLVGGKAQFQPNPGNNPPSDWIVVKNTHPALVKRSTFQAVQDRLNANPKQPLRSYTKDRFKLSKLLVCGECHSRMFGCCRTHKTVRENTYRCGRYMVYGPSYCHCNSVTETTLIGLITSSIQTILSSPEELKRFLESQWNDSSGTGKQLESASKLLKAKLWKAMAVLEQGTVSQVKSAFSEIFERIVLHFDQGMCSKFLRSKMRSGEIYLKLPGISIPTLRLSFSA